MIGVMYNLAGYRGLKWKLRREHLAGPLRAFWHENGRLIVLLAKENTEPNIWRNEVYDSIHYTVDKSSPPMWMRVESDSPHAIPLELGSKPHIPNIDSIIEYSDEPWPLIWHIADFGTKAYPFMEPAVQEAIPGLVANVGDLSFKIEMAYAFA